MQMSLTLTKEFLENLSEADDVEFKTATGRDGNGSLPKAFFETYSAFANTSGGTCFLGVEIKNGNTIVHGIRNIDKVKQELFNNLNNTEKVSCNLITNDLVKEHSVDSKTVIEVIVPQAQRKDKPVHLNKNPYTGTFIRQHDGDYHASEELIKAMIREQTSDNLDAEILDTFTLADLNQGTINAYRQEFKVLRYDHTINEKDLIEFLTFIGAWNTDRTTNKSGPTKAGLLMFGTTKTIRDQFYHYFLDYQEITSTDINDRYTDRFCNGTEWSGNLYDFYKTVIRKLHRDLKTPFQMQGDRRIDESPSHVAIREALINTLVHADYTGKEPIKIIKRPYCIEFTNPGYLRIRKEDAFKVTKSDCRNKNLQQMFRYIGLVEQAGYGLVMIHDTWEKQDLQTPTLTESKDQSYTKLVLPFESLFDEELVSELKNELGVEVMSSLTSLQRWALVSALKSDQISHSTLRDLRPDQNSVNISECLAELHDKGYLSKQGKSKGAYYFLSYKANSFAPVINPSEEDLEKLKRELLSSFTQEELDLYQEVTNKKRSKPEKLRSLILLLCKADYRSLDELVFLISRTKRIVADHISSMLEQKNIERFYDSPQHPKQKYKSVLPESL